MSKKMKWSKDLERGLNYFMGLVEEEMQKNETKHQTIERRKRMRDNAIQLRDIWNQCKNCSHFHLGSNPLCDFHEKLHYPCKEVETAANPSPIFPKK